MANRTDSQSRYGICERLQGSPRTVAIVAALLVVAVFLVFAQTGRHEFVNFDDTSYVYDNPNITGGLTLHGIFWVTFYRHSHNWHPLTGLTHLIDCQIYGVDHPGGHHITNILLHAANSVLLFIVLRRMTGRLWPSALATALFAIHPLRVESVAWVSERKDVLSGFFFMLTLIAYERYARRNNVDSRKFIWIVLAFVAGLLSKPMLVTVPVVLLLLDYWPLRRFAREPANDAAPDDSALDVDAKSSDVSATGTVARSTERLIFWPDLARLTLEKVPLIVLAVATSAITLFVQRDAMQSINRVPFSTRLINGAIACAAYLGEFFYPHRLAVLYPHFTTDIKASGAYAAEFYLVVISLAALLLVRRWPVLIVGWLWYLVMLLPVIGIIQVGGQAMADRYTYLPEIGIAIAIVWSADAICSRLRARWPFALVAACFVALLSVSAWRQTTFWRNSETLWNRDLSMYDNHNAVGNYNLGMTLAEIHKYDEAIVRYQQALEASSDDNRDTYINMGIAYAGLRKYDDAVESYRNAIKLDPASWDAHKNLGVALKEQGKLAESIKEWRLALKLNTAGELRDLGPTIAWTLASTPDDKLRDPAAAVELAKQVDDATDHNDPVVLDTLAVAYAALGRYDDALERDRKALGLLSAHAEAKKELIRAINDRINLFEAHKPYRAAQ